MKMDCFAACSFGLEAVVARELEDLGLEEVQARDARVYFSADEAGLARANLWCAVADRIYVVLGRFFARTFDELFLGVKDIRWENWLPKNARFPVAGDAVHSVLMSVSDIQSISKKAVVESLRRAYGLSFYHEDGEQYQIYVSILKDEVTVTLNASGAGLNRRGYRVKNSQAPLRETLAAGMIRLSRWSDRPFYDPMCGSGTIPIEAALMAKKRAPGLKRRFDAENWNAALEAAFLRERRAARDAEIQKVPTPFFASDVNEGVLETARFHAERAGVADLIRFEKQAVSQFLPQTEQGTLISNPPYAVRMGEEKEVHELYASLGRKTLPLSDFRCYFICADEAFERFYGKSADKKRKLYNGNLKCCFYQYFRKK